MAVVLAALLILLLCFLMEDMLSLLRSMKLTFVPCYRISSFTCCKGFKLTIVLLLVMAPDVVDVFYLNPCLAVVLASY